MSIASKAYETALKLTFAALNPLKKKVIKTECIVHKHLNHQALIILANDKHYSEFEFFKEYIHDINEGTVWADQDFKSSNHFFNPYTDKGLYGRSNAKDLAASYYRKAIEYIRIGDITESMFYFGASAHLIQDVTIPQHANVKLLDDHRQYENFVIKTYDKVHAYKANAGAYKLKSVENYVKFNGRIAIKVYNHYKRIKEDDIRFDKITRCILPLAERTTAGFMLTFFEEAFH